jgi:3(or 17)beta-hydroxysteroid dehydrogenase
VRLEGRIALVTGAAMGMGEAFSRRLAREGAQIVLSDIADQAGEAAAERICAAGGKARFVELDVASPEAWRAATDRIRSDFGRLDVLVNNAGIGSAGTIVDCSLDAWNKTIAVNLTGVFLGCQHAIPLMRQGGGGSIINISSIWAMASDQLAMAYSASKGGVRSLTKSAALYCATENNGVRVNSVHPGFVKTPMVENGVKALSEEAGAAYDARTWGRVPMGRIGAPQDIEGAIVFLASDDSLFMQGSELVVDGGQLCH